GTSNAPKLSGQFVSTGGTLSYFNTVFRIQSGVVTFEPDLGLVPTLTAVATTHVANPDPNAIRNFSGTADVTIDVSGPVTNLNIALSSSPPYDRDQILGLLLGAPMLGATNLFDQGGYPSGTLNRNSNGEVTIAQQAFGVLNAQFTRNLLSPFETQAAGALGLSNLNLNVDYTGAVGVSARKVLGKQVSAIYASTFGYPSRQSFGFEIKPNANTVAQLTLFTTVGASNLSIAVPAIQFNSTNYRITAAQPSGGESGFSFSLQLLR
ncbi:MAG TPA: translocation/assembly module TamB domain-containing protein, partial [Candidatus Baltobacteraceae bacterium]|nr:translocation/assembly module TamB domain-containing protein [Candidatus Baltobacteraceae bacterium]